MIWIISAQHMHNCDLINLKDMLENGTVISETMIETPHSFSTACNIATQIIAQVASNQYGGQSISLAHLIPFVDISRKSIYERVLEEFDSAGITADDEIIKQITEKRLMEEIQRGVQIHSVSACNADDNQWSGSVCYYFHVSFRG